MINNLFFGDDYLHWLVASCGLVTSWCLISVCGYSLALEAAALEFIGSGEGSKYKH